MKAPRTLVWVLCTDAFSDDALFLNGMRALPNFGLWAARKGQIRNSKIRRIKNAAFAQGCR
ncbi:hypothetical protein HMP0721_1204 [Pseudoramibacter alactolyticus ATCC 23263]|uniref:Uncharacterized protein n=1 Tax=Pseudoramibacter alactolyticus ATCC 23263 TaxID=887929 RepID=E6MGS1_9FIRM|nr:hypothetical protein HMP0721_1204 [Pseudoramibacter alactolyticus ATCC 23263]